MGTSLADFVQMVGRGMGNNRAVLQRYGLDCVRLMAMHEDWEALKQYYDCMDYLHRGPGPLPAGLANGTLQSGLVNVPRRFEAVLLHTRRQGQQRLNSSAVIRRVMQWEGEDEAAGDAAISGDDDEEEEESEEDDADDDADYADSSSEGAELSAEDE